MKAKQVIEAVNQSLEDYEFVEAKQTIKDYLKKGHVPDALSDKGAIALIKTDLSTAMLILEEMGSTFNPQRELGENTTWEWVLNRWLDQLIGAETQWFDAILKAETTSKNGFITNETIAELVITYIAYDGPTCLLDNPYDSSFVRLMRILNPREIGVTSLVEVPITELASHQQASALERYYDHNGNLPRWNGIDIEEIVVQNAGSCPKVTEVFINSGMLKPEKIDRLLMNVDLATGSRSKTSIKYLGIMAASGKYTKDSVRDLALKYIDGLFDPSIMAILDFIRS